MPFQLKDIGPKYDFGLSTRDGSVIECLDQNGKPQKVSQMAYMASVDKNRVMAEATELQEKSALIQFGSSNLIDREFDQWPQVTQGDWSSGIGQRVFGSNGISSQYFDGNGLVWPPSDWVPQLPLSGPIQPLPSGAPTDTGTETISPVGTTVVAGTGVLASFKATTTIALVGSVGAFTAGTNTSVSPPFGQATVATHLLVAWVSAGNATPTTAAAGWSQAVVGTYNNGQISAIWIKPNCGAGETAPTFTAGGGGSPMHAQLAEFSGAATVSPTDRTSSGYTSAGVGTLTISNLVADVASGDLVLMADRWQLAAAGTANFADSFNAATAVQAGNSGASSVQLQSSFTYGIVPSNVPNFSGWSINGTAGGYIEGLGMGYAVTYLDSQGTAHWHVRFYSGDATYDVDIGTNTGIQGPLHMHIAGGYLWVLYSTYPTTTSYSVFMLGCEYGSNVFVKLRSDAIGPAVGGGSGFKGLIAASLVAGKLYVAVLATDAGTVGVPNSNRNFLYLVDYSAGTGSVPTGLGVPFITFPFERGFKEADVCWQGSELVISVSDGFNAYIYTVTPSQPTLFTQAVLPGIAYAYLCAVGATLFIVAATLGPAGTVNRMALFTLNGSTLTEVPFNPPVVQTDIPSLVSFPILDSITSPVVFGSYAIWAASVTDAASKRHILLFAYDVVRGRLFRAGNFTATNWTGSDVFGHDVVGVFGVTQRTGAGVFQAQVGVGLFTGILSGNTETAREFYWGVQPITPAPSFSGFLQLGTELISGLIDFTAATTKLFRQVVVSFAGGMVQNSAANGVKVNVWLDQDPSSLASTPDFTATTPTPTTPPPVAGQLSLPINQLARKLVYDVSSFGPGFIGGAWQSCPKLVSVAVQAATGWVWDFVADLSPNSRSNSQNSQEYAYQAQSVSGLSGASVDHVVAYNFLKQLWRQKGGQCILTLPNGDNYPALLQMGKFESPKPFAASFRADQKSSMQWVASLKIREDI